MDTCTDSVTGAKEKERTEKSAFLHVTVYPPDSVSYFGYRREGDYPAWPGAGRFKIPTYRTCTMTVASGLASPVLAGPV